MFIKTPLLIPPMNFNIIRKTLIKLTLNAFQRKRQNQQDTTENNLIIIIKNNF